MPSRTMTSSRAWNESFLWLTLATAVGLGFLAVEMQLHSFPLFRTWVVLGVLAGWFAFRLPSRGPVAFGRALIPYAGVVLAYAYC